MKTATAIRTFISTPGHNPEMDYLKPTMQEIKDLKTACSQEEWSELGKQACDALGIEWEA